HLVDCLPISATVLDGFTSGASDTERSLCPGPLLHSIRGDQLGQPLKWKPSCGQLFVCLCVCLLCQCESRRNYRERQPNFISINGAASFPAPSYTGCTNFIWPNHFE